MGATYNSISQRIGRFKGKMLARAAVQESLARDGRQEALPANHGDTYIARRYLSYGQLSTNANTANRFFADGTGDRSAAMVQAHQTAEGITPESDSLTPMDVSVVMRQYSCLFAYTDKMALMHEDNIPVEMKKVNAERLALVNEQVIYGGLKGCTNQYFGGSGTTLATVNGKITLPLLRRMAVNLVANHGQPVNQRLKASPDFGTEAVMDAFNVYCHSNCEPDIRDLPNFKGVESYASGKPMKNEIGKCERFRFIIHPDLPEIQDVGAAIGALGLKSTTGTLIDVYQIVVTAQDAWSQVAVRGVDSVKIANIATGRSNDGSDPFGQRGLVGAMWWKAVMIENHGWMAIANVGITNLVG